jgi:hypothetical protein
VQDTVDLDADVEIKADDPEAWPIRIPTTLVWLQDSGSEPPDLEKENTSG